MQNFFYHYTTQSAWKDMQLGKAYGGNPADMGYPEGVIVSNTGEHGNCKYVAKGIWPKERFIHLFDNSMIPESEREKAVRSVIEGLLEPYPESWNNNTHMPHEFDRLMGVIGSRAAHQKEDMILLKINVAPSDEVYVADWSKARNFSDSATKFIAAADYYKSLVPLQKYSGQEGYTCPNVVCFNPIPLDRVEVVANIPSRWNMNSGDVKKALKLDDAKLLPGKASHPLIKAHQYGGRV